MLQFLEFVIRVREMARDLLYQAFRVRTFVGVGGDTPLGLGRAGAQSAGTSVTTQRPTRVERSVHYTDTAAQ